jgi:hypothetical protein
LQYAVNQPVRHHYTPQFYLSAWCSPGAPGEGDRLFVVQNFDGKIKYVRRPPKAIGYQDHLYSFSAELPTPEPAALEKRVFSPLDDKAGKLVAKLMVDERLSDDERLVWATFLAAMRARTPENIALVKERGTEHVRLERGKGQSDYEALKEHSDPASVLEWIESRYPGLIENFSLANLPRVLTGDVVVKINSMAWHALNFETGRHRLLCSDRPCVFTAGIDDRN